MRITNYRSFMIHALFLSLTMSFIDVNTVAPAMLTESGATTFHLGFLRPSWWGLVVLCSCCLLHSSWVSNIRNLPLGWNLPQSCSTRKPRNILAQSRRPCYLENLAHPLLDNHLFLQWGMGKYCLYRYPRKYD